MENQLSEQYSEQLDPTSSESSDLRERRLSKETLQQVGRGNSNNSGLLGASKEIWNQRYLAKLLINREIRAKYKNSSLGILWSLFKPISLLLIYYIAIGQFLGAARAIPDFAIFVFSGLTLWGLFSEIVSSNTSAIINNSGLIKKVYLPREIFVIATTGSAIFNFFIQFIVLFVATILLGRAPFHESLILAPLSLLLILLFGSAIGLLLSALNVYFRDIQHLIEIVLMVLFWASPIVYSFKFVHGLFGGGLIEQIYLANPITLSVLGFQKAMWTAGSIDSQQYWPQNLLSLLLTAIGVCLLLLWGVQRIFSKLQANFAQEL